MSQSDNPKRMLQRSSSSIGSLALFCSAGLLFGSFTLLTGCGNLPQLFPSPATPAPTPPAPTALPTSSPIETPTPTPASQAPKSKLTQELEAKLRTIVSEKIQATIQSMNCPNKLEVKVGDRFDCQVMAEGQAFIVGVEWTDQTGQFKWNTKGLLLLSKLEEFIQESLKEKGGLAVKADCGGELRAAKPTDSFECKVTDDAGATRSTKVTVKDEQGSVDISLL